MISLIITLVIVGVLLYCFNDFVPMDPKFKKLINVLVCLAAALYVLHGFGYGSDFGHHHWRD